ncbi:MAG: hypothetical protein AAFU85_21430 [Planctomycetota bacterium]
MNCDEFQRRLDSLLDDRADIASDPLLTEHSERCPRCAERLRIWSEIECCVSQPAPQSIRTDTRAWNSLISLAAAILLCATLLWRPSKDPGVPTFVLGDRSVEASEIDPWASSEFWTAVQDQNWVDQTMPAVDSMARGVAPIGRSVKQAAAILMNQVEPADGSTPTLVEPVVPGERTTDFVVVAAGAIA